MVSPPSIIINCSLSDLTQAKIEFLGITFLTGTLSSLLISTLENDKTVISDELAASQSRVLFSMTENRNILYSEPNVISLSETVVVGEREKERESFSLGKYQYKFPWESQSQSTLSSITHWVSGMSSTYLNSNTENNINSHDHKIDPGITELTDE